MAALAPKQKLLYSGRRVMAAPSGGDYHRHVERQKQLVDGALNLPGGPESAATGTTGH
jgi:2-oxoglutarate dehydrogenase complex dehydrogenase (E1) component-like enzyme